MTTTVTEALTRAARQCSVRPPSSWVTASQAKHVEIRDDFMLDTIDDISDRLDLPSPIGAQTTITGDGSEDYALPANFKRLQRDNYAVYDPFLGQPVHPISRDGDWTYIKDQGIAGAQRFYRIEGYDGNYTISLYGNPSASITLTVSYITKNWMATGAGVEGSMFTDEADVLLLPRRCVETGIVWRWRERKGLPYNDKYNEYEALLARLSNDSKVRRVINFGPRDLVRWQDRVPAFIPAS